MTIASVEIKLVKIDDFMDYCPGISIVNNTINIIAKIVFCVLNSIFKMENIKKRHWFANLNEKSFGRCLLLLVPVIGNIVIKMIDYQDKKKLIKLIEENGVSAFQDASYKFRSDIDVAWAALKKDCNIFNDYSFLPVKVDQKALKAKLFNHIAMNGFSGFSSNFDAYCFFAVGQKDVLNAKIFAYLKNSEDLDCFSSFFPHDASSQQMIIDLREKVLQKIQAGGQFDPSIAYVYRNDLCEILAQDYTKVIYVNNMVGIEIEKREELYRVAVNTSPYALQQIPQEFQTLEMITDALNKIPSLIDYVRPNLITEDLIVSLLLRRNKLDNFKIISCIPKNLQQSSRVLEAFIGQEKTERRLQHIPKVLQTAAMVEIILSHSIDMLEYVRSDLITKDLVLSLLKTHGWSYAHVQTIETHIPEELQEDPEVNAAFVQARRNYLDS